MDKELEELLKMKNNPSFVELTSYKKQASKFVKNVREEYVEPDFLNEYIDGSREKGFFRYSTEIFGELIDEIRKNSECGYETYMNDIIKDGYTPKYLSALQKELRFYNKEFNTGYKEVVASRILNFFGVPTTYDKLVEIGGVQHVLSVDFMRENEKIYNLEELDMVGECRFNLQSNLTGLINVLKKIYNKSYSDEELCLEYTEETQSHIKECQEQYVYGWLIRNFVLSDWDYLMRNTGILVNKQDNYIRLAPNYDMEYSFHNYKMPPEEMSKLMYRNVKFVSDYYPEIFVKFNNKLKDFVSYGKDDEQHRLCDKLVHSCVGNNKECEMGIVNVLDSNLQKLLPICYEIGLINRTLNSKE